MRVVDLSLHDVEASSTKREKDAVPFWILIHGVANNLGSIAP